MKRFEELHVGTRFEFRGRRYEKMNAEIGRDEERGGNVFHGSTEVEAEAGSLMADGGTKGLRAGVNGLRRYVPPTRPVVRPPVCVPQRRRWQRNRLGRSADRELRPYGTL